MCPRDWTKWILSSILYQWQCQTIRFSNYMISTWPLRGKDDGRRIAWVSEVSVKELEAEGVATCDTPQEDTWAAMRKTVIGGVHLLFLILSFAGQRLPPGWGQTRWNWLYVPTGPPRTTKPVGLSHAIIQATLNRQRATSHHLYTFLK